MLWVRQAGQRLGCLTLENMAVATCPCQKPFENVI